MSAQARDYFDRHASDEWERMEKSAYMRLVWRLHMDFISDLIKPGIRVLDAGGGTGRYTAELLARGCRVTLLDISPVELELAKEKISESGLRADAYVMADIRDMPMLDDAAYDMCVCYGAPLSYCLDGRERAMRELARVTKPRGTVAVSVNGVWGILREQIHAANDGFFANPEYWKVFEVAQGGDCPPFSGSEQPTRHFFNASELAELMRAGRLDAIELGGAPCLSVGARRAFPGFSADALDTIYRLELKSYRDPAQAGAGEFLLARGVVPDPNAAMKIAR